MPVVERAVGKSVHEAVAKRVYLLFSTALRHADASIASFCKGLNRDAGRTVQCRICRNLPVNMESPEVQCIGPKTHQEVRRANWGSQRAIPIGGKKCLVICR